MEDAGADKEDKHQQEIYAEAHAVLEKIAPVLLRRVCVRDMLFLSTKCRDSENGLVTVSLFDDDDLVRLKQIQQRMSIREA